MSVLELPEGFKPHFRKSGFTDPWEPLYSRVLEDRVQIGLFLGEAHCNSRGFAHGGLITTLADNAMGLSCIQKMRSEGREPKGLVTISLSTDFLGTGRIGQWLVVDTDHVKSGRSVAFARAMVRADGAAIAQASATFKVPE
jgi:acyl-coenzyme A thioesterase PaaI-like protein